MTGRHLLKDLRIDEVAFCAQGMNPEARMLIYKRKDAAAPVKKEDHEMEEPGTFSDHFESARLLEIDSAIDRRLFALLDTTTEIMRAEDIDDREERIVQAVNDYAATMETDVPALFAGRLAKYLAEWADESEPSDESVRAVLKSELEVAGLIGAPNQGGNAMKFLTTISKAARSAIDYVLGGVSAEDFFKGTNDEVGEFISKLTDRAVLVTGLESDLEKAATDLRKARLESDDDASFDEMLKGITDPNARGLIESQRAAIKKGSDEAIELRKAAQTSRLEAFVKSVPLLPNESGSLVETLRKAEAAGIGSEIEGVLVAANGHAEIAKSFEELGITTTLGDGAITSPTEAEDALVAKATEIRKANPELSAEAAYTRALERNPDLYEATRSLAN